MSVSLLQRARDSGKCSPSLLSEERVVEQDDFEEVVLKVLDPTGFFLAPGAKIGEDFTSILQKADSTDKISAATDELKKAVLVQRRCLLLAIVGNTPKDSLSLARVLSNGYLITVKSWLDDILNDSVGGVDLLLHLLANIVDLPVTKSSVKSSGMGKAVGSIEKHRICAGTANESAIKERVQAVKDAWQASVKALKNQEKASETKSNGKREADSPVSSPSAAKRIKVVDDAKKNSFSSLLKKVSASGSNQPKISISSPSAQKMTNSVQAGKSSQAVSPKEASEQSSNGGAATTKQPKKVSKRVKWADHFGGKISATLEIEGEEGTDEAPLKDVTVSWSDRKKRDRMREKELLAKVKKAKLLDDDDDNELDLPKPVQPTTAWRAPTLLPDRPDVTKAQLVSSEMSVQNERMKTVPSAGYTSEYEVPDSPAPLSDIEQALDMTSQSSAVVESIPFFVPQQTAATAAEPLGGYIDAQTMSGAQTESAQNASITPGGQSTAATPEFVQSLGLPMFLVGQDTQALQTLASSPSLLSTLVDASGMYDQTRLMSLVQTLSASTTGNQMQQAPASAYGTQQQSPGIYGPSSGMTPSAYGQPTSAPGSFSRSSFRGGSSESNLHISGYGPSTTQAEIISLFSPYVQVDEVVMKGTFAFVNTSDPANAQRAREALNGTLLGGMPVRINPAQRKSRDSAMAGSSYGGGGTSSSATFGSQSMTGVAVPASTSGMTSAPAIANLDSVRDDRGNPATKNLFVAGYGPGTTEEQLRDVFSQHATVIGVVLKGTFSFVNTSDRAAAVHAREALGGTMLNGGVMRINFAKETGRLGTSFDLTYGPNTGPNAARPQPSSMSYYGRG